MFLVRTSLRHVRQDVHEAILDHTVDALAAGELRVVPLEYLDAQVDQVDLMLVCICVQEVTHCFADEMNLLEVLILSDQLVEWKVIAETEVRLDELDVGIIWVCSYEGERLGLAELLNLQRELSLIFALWVGLLQLDVIELLELLKVGGKLSYSTCSLNPVEDEAVVAALLKKYGDKIRLLNVSLPGFKFQQGLKSWQFLV